MHWRHARKEISNMISIEIEQRQKQLTFLNENYFVKCKNRTVHEKL